MQHVSQLVRNKVKTFRARFVTLKMYTVVKCYSGKSSNLPVVHIRYIYTLHSQMSPFNQIGI